MIETKNGRENLGFVDRFSFKEFEENKRANCTGFAIKSLEKIGKEIDSVSRSELALVNDYAGVDQPTRHVTAARIRILPGGVYEVKFFDATPWKIDGRIPWGYNKITGGLYRKIKTMGSHGSEKFIKTGSNPEVPDTPFHEFVVIPKSDWGQLETNCPIEKISEERYPGIWLSRAMDEVEKLNSESKFGEALALSLRTARTFPNRVSPQVKVASMLSRADTSSLVSLVKREFPELSNLTRSELCLWFWARVGKNYKLQLKKLKRLNPGSAIAKYTTNKRLTRAEGGLKSAASKFPSANWGFLIFKPPRSTEDNFRKVLWKKMKSLLGKYGLLYLGSLVVGPLDDRHLRAIYPEDHTQPYWEDLVINLKGKSAVLVFFQLPDGVRDIKRKIHWIKGWVGRDIDRGRYQNSAGLRKEFGRILEQQGEIQAMINPSKEVYLDTGIHASLSIESRYYQLLSLMGCDKRIAEKARELFPFLNSR
ncbi:MAG: hypothetical protein WD940_01450 [Patescibacteria group bacterium]